MKRKQIYLDEAADARLKAMALRLGRSEASLIRDALDQYLDEHQAGLPSVEANPLLELIGLAPEGPVDGARNHDRYLYEERG